MKDEDDKDLDQLFKNRLQDSENLFAYNEEDWLSLEAKLDKKENRRATIYWLRIGSSIAAMLLLCFGLWFFNQTTPENESSASKKTKPIERKLPTEEVTTPATRNIATTKKLAVIGAPQSPAPVNRSKESVKVQYQVITPVEAQVQQEQQNRLADKAGESKIDTNKAVIAANTPIVQPEKKETVIAPVNVVAANNNVATIDPNLTSIGPAKKDKSIDKKSKKPITYAVSIIAASDLNGINSLKQTKVGTNYGALFNVGIAKKLTLQTGLIYSDKPYQSNSDSYTATYTSPYAAKYNPISVYVDCKMFDVPLNLDYQLFENRSNKISLGTGLSSYIMLHENYEYNFDPASNYATKNYEVPDSKAYLFSILNLSATYERKLSNRIGFTAQPYLKVPLRAVGYGDVKLQSAGLSLGLKLNLNKPIRNR